MDSIADTYLVADISQDVRIAIEYMFLTVTVHL